MAKRTKSRIFWRDQGGESRAYVDLRDLGGGRKALIPPGDDRKRATTDPDVAAKLASDEVAKLEQRERNEVLLGIKRQVGLKEYAAHHLREKAKAGRVTHKWIKQHERMLGRAVAFIGADRNVAAVSVEDCQRWAHHLSRAPLGRGGEPYAPGTVRHHLNALSNLYRRAQAEDCVPPGFNPVSAMIDKPTAARKEARWLEVHDAALLLESARTYKEPDPGVTLPFMFPLVATFLLTGGRRSEVLGLDLEDVSFDRKTVTFRPNAHRRLKTTTSHRVVPLWPQLEEILRAYVFGGSGPRDGLLFPSPGTGKMVKNARKALDLIAKRVSWKAGEIRTKMFRHTYCAARLQTLDRGHPVSPWTVSREMGHGGRALVDRVYGHLGDVRHRSEVVEYRVEQHQEELGERLKALQAKG